jgi:glycosyltransferase involved in cell wall biosynthesis
MVDALHFAHGRGIRASWFSLAEAETLNRFLDRVDVLVIARVRYSRTVGDLIARARIRGIRVLFDCDDLVFDVRYTHLVSATLDQDTASDEHWQAWFAMVGRLQATAALCDGGITTNRQLADRMEDVVDGPVMVVQNFLNRRQQDLSERLLTRKIERRFRSDAVACVGYFSGTPTHNRDFEVAMPALLRLLESDQGVSLRIVGFMGAFRELDRFGARVQRLALQDWLNLQIKVAEVDVNIVPLQANPFTFCKSELKYFEAAVVGTFTCATPTPPFAAAIEDRVDGRLVDGLGWYQAISESIELIRDSDLYSTMARRAADRVVKRYGWDQQADAIVRALTPP